MAKGPVLFEVDDDTPVPSVSDAPPVPDPGAPPQGRAMQTAARLAAARPSRLARAFWALLMALLGAVISVAAWDWVTGLIARNVVLGYGVTALVAAFLLVCTWILLREFSALVRLRRVDALRADGVEARVGADLKLARDVTDRLDTLYAGRPDTGRGRQRVQDLRRDLVDASALLDLAEQEVLAPLDRAAEAAVEAAARQVATVTALVPLALADVAAALTSNVRMIRQVAEIYGGRSGLMGSWRLTRAVLAHLVATGAVAVGDDLLEPVLGGSILGKLSRRFGEGLVNGALTARVGVAAMEVCRPLPFVAEARPRARDLVRGALVGIVPGGDAEKGS